MTRSFPRLFPLGFSAVALFAAYSLVTIAAQPLAASGGQQSPFYCDKGALSPAERTQHFDVLGPSLVARRRRVRELPDGYEIQFASDRQTFLDLSEFVEAERRCCPFFDITLRMTPEHGPLWVRFTGRPGTKQFIEADGGDWIKPVG